MDKLRRFLYIIGAEIVSFFEWTIWTSILVLFLGVPTVTIVLQNLLQGILVPAITVVVIWAMTLLLIGLAEGILSVWPFDVSEEELDFETKYEPRIPND